jgi:hypothetical protein
LAFPTTLTAKEELSAMNIYVPIYGYVYKITNIITNKYYFGSRTATIRQKIEPEKDIWIRYFTSSLEIKKQIEYYGKDSFLVEIVFKSNDGEEVFWKEQSYIKDNINCDYCINKHYLDRETGAKVFSTFGKTPWNKGKPSLVKGIVRNPDTIELMSKNRKGKTLGKFPGIRIKSEYIQQVQ